MRGSREGSIIGGVLLLVIDLYGISEGRLPLKGRFDTAVDLAERPDLFWAYSVALGVIGLAAIVWGLTRPE